MAQFVQSFQEKHGSHTEDGLSPLESIRRFGLKYAASESSEDSDNDDVALESEDESSSAYSLIDDVSEPEVQAECEEWWSTESRFWSPEPAVSEALCTSMMRPTSRWPARRPARSTPKSRSVSVPDFPLLPPDEAPEPPKSQLQKIQKQVEREFMMADAEGFDVEIFVKRIPKCLPWYN